MQNGLTPSSLVVPDAATDHAREVEAKSVFPWERPIVDTRDVVFLYASEGKTAHGVGHGFYLPACPAPSEALSSSSLITTSLITDPANLTSAPASPVSTKSSAGWLQDFSAFSIASR
jgi:hypothetical protein